MTPARILLADDHAVVRAGLRNALTGIPDLEVVGEVGDGLELVAALDQLKPDFLLVDVAMPDFEPVTAVRRIKSEHPDLKVLVVSAYDDEAYVVGLLEAGVDGYHLKDQPLADLQLAVKRILSGDRWISGPLVERLVRRRSTVAANPAPQLTRRQRELLRLLAQGSDNRTIAQTTGLSVKTVENHLTRLYRALGVFSRLEALNYVMRNPEVLAAAGQELADEPEAEPEATLTVLLVDDNPRYRQQLGRLIGKTYPAAMLYEAEDISAAVLLTERGASFGYNTLWSDMRALPIMRDLGYPVVFDATHSVQLPGAGGTASSGDRKFVPHLARAATAAGIDALFMEVHACPDKALCDGPNMLSLDELPALLKQVQEIDRIVKK